VWAARAAADAAQRDSFVALVNNAFSEVV
jgi:hypothetical protein